MIHQSVWYCWMTTTKTVVNPFYFLINLFFFFSSLAVEFFLENGTGSRCFFITESSSLDAYGKTSSWILSICSTVYLFRRGCTLQQNQNVAIIFWWDMFFSNSFSITFTWCFNRVYIWNNLFLSFSLDNFAYQLNFCLLSFESSVTIHLHFDLFVFSSFLDAASAGYRE